MPKITQVSYSFVDSAPETLVPGTLYISTKYRAIVHLCLCGCNEKVLLKLDPDPDSWSFTFDGRTISIHDSVGNVGLPCRSHYVVRRNRVNWLPPIVDVDPKLAMEQRPKHEEQREEVIPNGFSRWFRRRHRKARKA